jgi:hypothetical protein
MQIFGFQQPELNNLMESLIKQEMFLEKESLIVLLVKTFGFNTVEYKNSKTLKMSSYKDLETFPTAKNYGFMQQNFKKIINK